MKGFLSQRKLVYVMIPRINDKTHVLNMLGLLTPLIIQYHKTKTPLSHITQRRCSKSISKIQQSKCLSVKPWLLFPHVP